MQISLEKARTVVTAAYRTRRAADLPLETPTCPIDAASRLGVEVRFEPLSTLEGLYAPDPKLPIILLGSDRPRGRQATTCAHELGHHVLRHQGGRIDVISDHHTREAVVVEEEVEANLFAGHFQAPLPAVERALRLRNQVASSMSPMDIYALSCLFGVGYSAMVAHLCYALKKIDVYRYGELKRETPQTIIQSLIGGKETGLVLVDQFWAGRAIDLRVGEAALLPPGTQVEGRCATVSSVIGRGVLVRAVSPGIGTCFRRADGWSSCIRVCPILFKGRAIWRHMEVDHEE